ncbi:PIN domain-containing protein [Methanothermobacter wolfeii]|jgi:hypothetical protein|uniref:Twitching motility protein PilT n=1 Tax=Methanothermobacter thermautotrophicus TaxID=145262 RepID=A0A7J4MTS1_METTF|nr:PIN domain-containing protein [Methanothermobacter wolfeii]MDI6702849.1 twitching motility protein PilT [Methanothermobacter wolfeii]HIH64047.1 twitching motility protein PilT [Methanothermobacter thermautotrophicus]HIH70656.1 twitching motility protein PilT [Methanothermobacter thermautotrophicus]
MIPYQFNVDIVSELERLFPTHDLVVPSFVIGELEAIRRRSRGRAGIAASVGLSIARRPPFRVVREELREGEDPDDALLRISEILCTNDRELRRRARSRGITVVYLRQKKYLTVDGHI